MFCWVNFPQGFSFIHPPPQIYKKHAEGCFWWQKVRNNYIVIEFFWKTIDPPWYVGEKKSKVRETVGVCVACNPIHQPDPRSVEIGRLKKHVRIGGNDSICPRKSLQKALISISCVMGCDLNTSVTKTKNTQISWSIVLGREAMELKCFLSTFWTCNQWPTGCSHWNICQELLCKVTRLCGCTVHWNVYIYIYKYTCVYI